MPEYVAYDEDGNERIGWVQDQANSCGPACIYCVEMTLRLSCIAEGEQRIRELLTNYFSRAAAQRGPETGRFRATPPHMKPLLESLRALGALVRRYPGRTALALPVLMLVYVLLLIPSPPGISDLRRAKAATPSVVMSVDGVVLAEFKRLNRKWVPLQAALGPIVQATSASFEGTSRHPISARSGTGVT